MPYDKESLKLFSVPLCQHHFHRLQLISYTVNCSHSLALALANLSSPSPLSSFSHPPGAVTP